MNNILWDEDNTATAVDGFATKVEYKSEVLGEGVFWEGASKDAGAIRNIPVRSIAKYLAKEGGGVKKYGMWTVTVEATP